MNSEAPIHKGLKQCFNSLKSNSEILTTNCGKKIMKNIDIERREKIVSGKSKKIGIRLRIMKKSMSYETQEN